MIIASIRGIEYLVSWNFEHMVNVEVRKAVDLFNVKSGYPTIEIVCPSELR